ncbi:MAG TPA: protein kinase [Kofleriaceae bacterium]|nr:protein kinase [Kofleriaceae bacterium]
MSEIRTGAVLGRYVLRGIVGAGGMGVVWSAHDRDLDRTIALKVLRGEAGPVPRARLLREARAMARLKHPNVLTVYEVGSVDDRDFIAMELVDGESLDRWLEREPARAQVIDALLASGRGLAAAHAAGLVHRDFKPHNVLRDRDGRVLVTDFGLARAHDPGATPERAETIPATPRAGSDTMTMTDDSQVVAPIFAGPPVDDASILDSPLTEAGAVVGTPAYMAPEQFAGATPDPRTDQFAFCVTAWEMLTGARPYRGADVDAIRDAAGSGVRRGGERLPSKVRPILERGLDPDPAKRWPDMQSLLEVLERALRPRSRARVWLAVAPIAIAAIAVTIAIAIAGGGSSSPAPAPAAVVSIDAGAPAARRAIAIVGFDDLANDPSSAWMGGALGELLATELGTGDRVRVVPGDDVARERAQRGITRASGLNKASLGQLHDDLGADLVVGGVYVASGGLRVDVRVMDARTGETIMTVSASDGADALVPLVAKLGASLRDRLGVARLSDDEQKLARAAMPANAEAARLYTDGLAKLRTFDPQGARAALEAATKADPDFPLAYSALAAAWDALGDDGAAKAAAQQALDRSASLARADRLAVEARLRQVSGDHDKAVALFRSLFEFFPDRIDYGLELANEQILAAAYDDAKATLVRLRALGPAADDAIRIDITASMAAASRGDFAECQETGARAVAAADARGATLLAAKARAIEAWGRFHTGDLDGAIALYTKAEAAFAAAGAQAELAATQLRHAAVPWRRGDLASAQQLVDAAVAVYQRLGHQRGMADGLMADGILALEREDRRAAMKAFGEALAIQTKLGDQGALALTHMQIGNVQLRDGDQAAARKSYDTALQLAHESGAKSTEELAHSNLALLLAQAGEIDGARQHYEDAIAIARQIGDHSTEAYAENGLGDLAQDRNDNADALAHYKAGKAAADAGHDPRTAAEAQAGIAETTLAEGDNAAAASAAAAAANALEQVGELDVEATSLAIEARAYVRDGKAADARAAIDHAKDVAAKAGEPGAAITVATVESEVLVLEGKASAAIAILDHAQRDARDRGLHQREYSVRLARGKALIAAGRAREGKAELASLERDATGRGWTGIAKSAAEALAAAP